MAGHRIELRDVGHRYRGRGADVDALTGVDLTIEPGEFVSVVGPSGCGKTTVLQILAGFLQPSSGVATVGGDAIAGPSPDRGVVFQQPNLYPWKSVRDNVALGPQLRGAGRRERHEIADRHLALVGLSDFGDAAPYELSGGMQQRTQIARVLANDPDVLLMDEPFGALDALTRERLQDELLRIWRGSGKTVVFVTHSVEEAAYLGTRVLVMSPRPGRVVLDEPVPFDPDTRDAALRLDPAFAEFRRHVGERIGSYA
ncbi:ABC transporter ATP-binding protein [Patulibacter americanus]|uniref:ABC transporter ATP-binding protein n=1 Tax=Patulibacter americanus TaxID=588672 RepID=UPI0003B5526D|nr:ABC transporter ATP-binding protein [Patulibacter americanus]